MTQTLVQFLRAQLDEDARIARRAGDTFRQIGETGVIVATEGDRAEECATANWAGIAEHIVVHDPARVLHEIDAKRALIARGGPFCTSDCDQPGNEPMDPDTNWTTPLEHHFDCAAYDAAGVLALPYADRPGYQEKWRP